MLGRQGKVRTELRAAWEVLERILDRPYGRPILLAISRLAMRVQYGKQCRVSYTDVTKIREPGQAAIWKYDWPGQVVMSDRPLLARARPDQIGRLAGVTMDDDYLWDYAPQRGDVVVDIGAGIGEELYTLISRVGPEGKVFAVEAHPRPCEILERLREANGWDNLTIINAAIVDGQSVGDMVKISDGRFYDRNHLADEGIAVPTITLDAVVERVGGPIDYLKMNIEGAEQAAFSNAPLAAQSIRHATISCHDFIGVRTKEFVAGWFEAAGFELRHQAEPPHVEGESFVYARQRS